MKAFIAGCLLLAGAAVAHADCVGTDPSYTQYCAMITDQSECAELTGFCQWADSSTTTSTCSGQSPYCAMITDQNECTEIGCTWGSSGGLPVH